MPDNMHKVVIIEPRTGAVIGRGESTLKRVEEIYVRVTGFEHPVAAAYVYPAEKEAALVEEFTRIATERREMEARLDKRIYEILNTEIARS